MTRRALLTRPRPDAAGTMQALQARGFEVVLEPMLDIVALPDVPVDLTGVQAILVTSANGVRALADAMAERRLPVLTVGEASARTARMLGFQQVISADGDVHSLARLARRRLDPGNGVLLHAAASQLAGDLKGMLEEGGFEVRRIILYEAREADALSDAARAALADGSLDAALFYSPRTAVTFARLLAAANLVEACAGINAYGLSPAVANAIRHLPWRRLRIAEKPRQDALLALIDEDFGTVPEGEGRGKAR